MRLRRKKPTTTKKLLALNDAVELAQRQAARLKGSVSEKEELIFEMLVKACPPVQIDGEQFIVLDVFKGFIENFSKAIETQDSSYLFQRRGNKITRIPDIQEFAESKEFFRTKLWPAQLDYLWELHCSGNYYEIGLLCGATSAGKSTMVRISMGYQLMLAGCLWNPQLEYGFAPGTDMTWALQSITQELCYKILFRPLYGLITTSSWFLKNFPPDKEYKSELRFPGGVFCRHYGGTDTAVLGQDLVAMAATELNRGRYIEHSKQSAFGGDYDQALEIFETAANRIKGRTMQAGGKIPGYILVDAASEYPGDFTSRKKEEAKHNDAILVYDYTQWEARGFVKGKVTCGGRYSGDVFHVEIGDEDRESRVLVTKEQATPGARILEVPVEHRRDFDSDVNVALRDFAGIVIGGVHRYIPWTSDIKAAAASFADVTSDRQLFMFPEVCLNDYVNTAQADEEGRLFFDVQQLEDIINTAYINDQLVGGAQQFALHIDLGLKFDSAGIALGHVAAYRMTDSMQVIDRTGRIREVRDVSAPIYQIDGLLRVVAPAGGEIDFELLEHLAVFLKGKLNIVIASFDGFQSTHFIQRMRRVKVKSGVLSVDANLGPMNETKLAIRQHRIWYPGHPVLIKEFTELEYDPQKQKVDHPPHGSKDLADAVAGCVFILLTRLSKLQRQRANPARAAAQMTRKRRYLLGG